MKKLLTYALSVLTFLPFANAQNTDSLPATANDSTAAITSNYSSKQAATSSIMYSNKSNYPQPYKVTFKKDAPIIVAGIGLTALGTYLINQKDSITNAQLATKTRDNLPFFDRGNAGYYSEKADRNSYVPFKLAFGWPVALALLSSNERHDLQHVLPLYLETMAVTGTIFTMATGTIYRSRPYVYTPAQGPDYPDASRRRDKDSQRAFFAGHTAATAAATFFAAKAFSDYNPDSKWKPVIWVVAAATPALVGYWRYKAGMHFLSDNVIGYAVGAAAGILIPKWHKIKGSENVSVSPEVGSGYKGLAITYHIK